jgi:hypothetical protein
MEKQDINEIYGENNIYNQQIIICLEDYSPIIELYIDEDGVVDNWTLDDHVIVWQWCLNNIEQINTKEKYEMLLK